MIQHYLNRPLSFKFRHPVIQETGLCQNQAAKSSDKRHLEWINRYKYYLIYHYVHMNSQFLTEKWYKALPNHHASLAKKTTRCDIFIGKKQNVHQILQPKEFNFQADLDQCFCESKYDWWFRNPAITSWYGKSPFFCRVLYIPGGARCLPSTVSQRKCKFMLKTSIIWVATLEVLLVCRDRM